MNTYNATAGFITQDPKTGRCTLPEGFPGFLVRKTDGTRDLFPRSFTYEWTTNSLVIRDGEEVVASYDKSIARAVCGFSPGKKLHEELQQQYGGSPVSGYVAVAASAVIAFGAALLIMKRLVL